MCVDGTCTSSCYTTGCNSICASGCTSGCGGDCEGGCSGGCNTTCNAKCASKCSGECSGGCGGCDTSCSGKCAGCTGGCSGGCNTGCLYGCSGGCKGDCSGSCKSASMQEALDTLGKNILIKGYIKEEDFFLLKKVLDEELKKEHASSTPFSQSMVNGGPVYPNPVAEMTTDAYNHLISRYDPDSPKLLADIKKAKQGNVVKTEDLATLIKTLKEYSWDDN